MAMWIAFVEKKVTHMVMVDGWQYSNGAGEEYLQAVLMQMGDRGRTNMTITDQHGKTLKLHKGLRLLTDAFLDVHSRGMDAGNMAETLARLIEAERRYAASRPKIGHGHGLSYDRREFTSFADKATTLIERDYPDVESIVKKVPTASFPLSTICSLDADSETLSLNPPVRAKLGQRTKSIARSQTCTVRKKLRSAR